MKNILVQINSNIDQHDGETHTIEMMSEGQAYEKNGHLYIVYEETEVSGMKGSKTVLKLDNGTVTMTRFGSNNSKMVFNEMHPMTSLYKTPYGDFEMTIETKSLNTDIDLSSYTGMIKIMYSMSLEGVSNSMNHIEIKVSEVIE